MAPLDLAELAKRKREKDSLIKAKSGFEIAVLDCMIQENC